jgi:hypothetical protein
MALTSVLSDVAGVSMIINASFPQDPFNFQKGHFPSLSGFRATHGGSTGIIVPRASPSSLSCSFRLTLGIQMRSRVWLAWNSPSIAVGTFDCEWYGPMCRELGVQIYPDYEPEDETGIRSQIRGFNRGEWSNYTGSPSLNGLVQNINRICGVDRRIDGLLGESPGRIPEADEIAKEFITADNQEELIAKMKAIQGAEFYVKIMERFVAKGFDQMKKDIAAMKKNLEMRKGSRRSLDEIKKRYNVINQFIPKVTPTPKPTKQHEPKTENDF